MVVKIEKEGENKSNESLSVDAIKWQNRNW
jgi:hypothetical protein